MSQNTRPIRPGDFCLLLRGSCIEREHLLLILEAAHLRCLGRIDAALEEAPDDVEAFCRARQVHRGRRHRHQLQVRELLAFLREGAPARVPIVQMGTEGDTDQCRPARSLAIAG